MPDTENTTEKTIPYDRFQQVVNERNSLKQERDSLLEKVATVDTLAAEIGSYKTKVEEYKTQLAQSADKFTRFQALSTVGILDPEIVELTEWTYSKLPEKDRPNFGDWLKSLKEDPTKAPVTLRPHLTPAQENTQATNTEALKGKDNAGVVQTRTQGVAFTPQQISRMSREEYKKHREEILKSAR